MWPPYLAWKSDRAHGFYGSGLVLVCVVLLLALRLAERRSRLDVALLGLVLGLGWWQTPQVVPIALPALAWLLWQRPGLWRDVWIAAPVAAVAALPWLVSNLAHDWWSFDISSGQTPYPTRLRGFFSATFPMAFGLRVPFTSEWPLGTALSGLVYAGLICLFAVAWWRHRTTPAGLLFGVVAAFPFLYALSPSTWIVDEPRYVVVLLPVLALVFAMGLTTVPRAAVAVLGGAALSAFVLWHLTSSPAFVERADGLFVPPDFDPLIAELDRQGIDRVFASYWVAYRLDFETSERILAAETTMSTVAERQGRVLPSVLTGKPDENRHAAYDAIVRADPDAGFVLLRDEPEFVRVATDPRRRRLRAHPGRRLRGVPARGAMTSRRLLAALVLLAAAAGIALRVWVYRSALGIPDSDEAVVGLMVRHFMRRRAHDVLLGPGVRRLAGSARDGAGVLGRRQQLADASSRPDRALGRRRDS